MTQVPWYVYIVECADKSLYTGITTNLDSRIKQHNENNRLGSKYTRVRRPVALVYSEIHESKSSAAKREAAIKKLGRTEKMKLIS
jgi:putative endonuclease